MFGFVVPSAMGRERLQEYPSDQSIRVHTLPCLQSEFPRAEGLRQLAWETMKRTSLQVDLEARQVEFDDPTGLHHPLLLWSCPGPIGSLGQSAVFDLKQFLVAGGTLWIDDPSADPGGAFDRSIRSLLESLLPEKKLESISRDHVVFKSFYLTRRKCGRVLNKPLEGIRFSSGRLAVIYSSNDLLGALAKDYFGDWKMPCEPGGTMQRDLAFRLGVNLMVYLVCMDYKDDGVHLPFILKRRKR